jgi:hypothetical protein
MSEPDVDRELERLLEATRDGTEPDAEARARIRRALGPSLAALTAAAATGASAGVKTSVGSKLTALWLGGVLTFALVLAALWSLGHSRPTPSAAPRTSSAVSRASEAVPAPLSSTQSSSVPALSALPSSAPLASAPLNPVARPLKTARPVDDGAELALIAGMQAALRAGKPSEVLSLASEHAKRFPHGTLGVEREGARAIARCQLAESADRAEIREAFERRYASSPYLARVNDACRP